MGFGRTMFAWGRARDTPAGFEIELDQQQDIAHWTASPARDLSLPMQCTIRRLGRITYAVRTNPKASWDGEFWLDTMMVRRSDVWRLITPYPPGSWDPESIDDE